MSKNFKDHFSSQSNIYALYRPHYPNELFAYLASLTQGHNFVWDCGTGNGQAAIGLAPFYNKIIATDPSDRQIQNAFPNDKVQYSIEKAEDNSINNTSVDLVTVANALHWFEFDKFYNQVNRVLKPNGIIAAWAYGSPSVLPEVDLIIKDFHDNIVGSYWVAENGYVTNGYATLPFPFIQMKPPQFFSKKLMALNEFIGYFNTWSATQKFILANGYNPTEKLFTNLLEVWPNPTTKLEISWKLVLKVGSINAI